MRFLGYYFKLQSAFISTISCFTGNVSSEGYCGGIRCAGGSLTIINTLVAFNSSGIYQRPGFTTNPVLLKNGMYNGSANYVGLPPGASDLVGDPLFVDRPSGDGLVERCPWPKPSGR